MRRFPPGRTGTSVRQKLCVAAGAGAIAALLTVGGGAIPLVAADPGHSRDGGGSHRSDGDSNRGGGDSRRGGGDSHRGGGGDKRGGDAGRDRDGGYGQKRGDRGGQRRDGVAGPYRRDGPSGPWRDRDPSRTDDDDDTDGSNDLLIQPSPAARTASPGLATADTADPTDTGDTDAPVPPPANAARSDSAGADSGGAAVTFPNGVPFTPPTVTIGDGRAPGILTWRHGAPGAPTQAPAGPADVVDARVIPVIEAPSPPVPPHRSTPQPLPPASRLDVAPPWQRTVASMWAAAAEPSAPGGVAFGVAGLFLAPLAGVWLGYRQARASRAAAQLVDR